MKFKSPIPYCVGLLLLKCCNIHLTRLNILLCYNNNIFKVIVYYIKKEKCYE